MRKQYTENDYILKCNQINMEYIGNHKENKRGTMIEFVCPKHRDKGIQTSDWSHFKNYSKGCPYCTGRYRTTEEFEQMIPNKSVILMSGYRGFEKPIKCKCKDCGNVWTTIAKVLCTDGCGCPKCGHKRSARKQAKTTEQFKADLYQVNPNIEVIGEYVNTHTKIKCRCKIDGFEWESYPANLLNLSAGCPYCNMSTSEVKMINTLTKLGINFKTQYTIPDCKLTYKLKFDAFDIENDIAFEYNGEQHYKPIDFAGKGEEWANYNLELTRLRDKTKYKYCKEHSIPIIIIPYWERDNMENYIIQELNKLKE